ncbi:NADP-dependent malic enzyme [Merluccius polli]|uniref:Malic enzyme n=1 Tax=Merluccius polli TaxID=89951 RepID=A0AA47N121_MERPO|nr:NADP-dependent malic enzyme [Merluccius polli]
MPGANARGQCHALACAAPSLRCDLALRLKRTGPPLSMEVVVSTWMWKGAVGKGIERCIAFRYVFYKNTNTAKVLVPCILGLNCGSPGQTSVADFQSPEVAQRSAGLSDWLLDFAARRAGDAERSASGAGMSAGGCKGMAFSLEERLQLGIHGLLPPCFISQDVQLLQVLRNYDRKTDPLDRYVFLMGLQDRNEKLFYRVLTSDIERFMPIVYTPTVGLACQLYGLTFRRPRGLFITVHDRGHIATLLQSWPEKDIRAVCVTDGERILGLGDLGCYGMGIPVGKLALYTACGGMPPMQCLPVMLDVGTDNEELLEDPLYIGLRHKRVRGQAYDDLLDEFMKAVTDRYGMDCLIQFEDFANVNAFRLLSKYRHQYCTFNDDIQGTAAVAVAGLLAALRITKSKMSDHTIVFQGAGEAAMGIAELITMAMEKEGLAKEACLRKIWMVDSKGLIVKGRDSLTHEKLRFAHEHPQMKRLEEVVKELKPTAIIGVAAIPGAFTEQIIRDMASFNQRPIIFALSNPTSKAECTAEQCYTLTEGRGIFASGSPFDPVTLEDGRKFFPGQGNNAYVFPGVGLGVTACLLRHVTDQIFLITAEVIL